MVKKFIVQMAGGPKNPWGEWPQAPKKNASKMPPRKSNGSGGNGGNGGHHYDDDFFEKMSEFLKNKMPSNFLHSPKAIIFSILVAVVLWLLTGFYTVGPKEVGVELVFGKASGLGKPGLNYNLPSPIGEVVKPQVTNVNQVEIGFRTVADNTPNRDLDRESLMLTGDENIIDVQFVVFWRISNAENFLFNIRNPEQGVHDIAEAAMREIIGKSEFEFARTRGRSTLALQAQELMQRVLDSYDSGIEIVNVNLQRVDPPGVVLDAFRDVQAARADKERTINEATAYLNELTQRAQGQSEQIINAAEAYLEEKVSEATGDSDRFLAIYEEYKDYKEITKRRIYLQTMEKILGDMEKILIAPAGEGSNIIPYLPLDRLLKNKGE